MLARLKSEFAYARGLIGALRRSTSVVKSPNRTLRDHFDDWAVAHAGRPALLGQGESFTYRELAARTNRYARWAIARGLRKGDAICLMMPNRPEYVAIWLGFARVGVATALINTNLTGPSLAHSIAIVSAKAVIVDASLAQQFAGARESAGEFGDEEGVVSVWSAAQRDVAALREAADRRGERFHVRAASLRSASPGAARRRRRSGVSKSGGGASSPVIQARTCGSGASSSRSNSSRSASPIVVRFMSANWPSTRSISRSPRRRARKRTRRRRASSPALDRSKLDIGILWTRRGCARPTIGGL